MSTTLQTGGFSLFLFFIVAIGAGICLALYFAKSSNRFFPKWKAAWLAISSLICTWDTMFVFNRASSLYSFNNPIWAPYQDYVNSTSCMVARGWLYQESRCYECCWIFNQSSGFVSFIGPKVLTSKCDSPRGLCNDFIKNSSLSCLGYTLQGLQH